MIRALLLLIFFLVGTCCEHSASGSGYCGNQGKGCNYNCPGGEYRSITDPEKIKPCLIDESLGLGKVAIGWGESCAIGAGSTSVSDKSCLPGDGPIKEIQDTLATLGLAAAMRKSFCSFAPGDPNLEGGFISKNFLSQCTSSDPDTRADCVKCLFEGRLFDGKKCVASDCAKYSDAALKADCTKCNFKGYVFNGAKCENLSPLKGDEDYVANLCDAIPNLEKPLLDSSGRQAVMNIESPLLGTEAIPIFCPLTRCNIPTNDIKVKYRDDFLTRFLVIMFGADQYPVFAAIYAGVGDGQGGDCCDARALEDGETRPVGTWSLVQLRGRRQSDQICAQMWFGFTGWTNLACKPRVAPKITFPDLPCFVENSACSKGKSHSKWFLPITSKVMECTTDVFNTLFRSSDCANSLLTFQKNMQVIVRLLLILYIVIFGIQIAFGKSISKREFFSFILKFALVVFFAVGNLYKSGTPTDMNKNGLLFLRELATSGMTSFSEMVMSASGGMSSKTEPGLCNFSDIDYGKDQQGGSYDYLKTWDALDCRLTFYLGLATPTTEGVGMIKGGGASMRIGRGILNMFWSLLFAWRLPILIFLLLFTIFLLSMVVHLVHLYILAMIAVSILIFFGPIFIPLALFGKTKDFCDQWVKLLIGYSLQPVMVMAIISFMLITFDKILFTDCRFKYDTFNGIPYWVMEHNPSPTCQKSLGYMVQFFSDRGVYRESADTDEGVGGEALFYYNSIKDDVVESTIAITSNFTLMLEGLMFGTFFAFLFYFFAGQMSALATELSGGPSLDKYAVGATAVWDAAYNIATRGAFSKAKNAAGAGKDSGSKASQEGVDSGSQATTSSRSGVSASVSTSKDLGAGPRAER